MPLYTKSNEWGFLHMGYSPKQDFIFGFLVPEEFEGDVYDLAEDLGIDCAFSGSLDYGADKKAVGLELDSWKVVDDYYLGGFQANRFTVDYFLNWLEESKEKMNDELQQKIKETFQIREDALPELWNLSSAG